MKKRAMSLLLVLLMVISLFPSFTLSAAAADDYTVYAVVGDAGTVEIRFHKGDSLLNTQRVKKDAGDLQDGAIYDPGVPLEANEVFEAWSFGGQTGDIDAVLAYVNAHYADLQKDGLDVTAVTANVRYLVYHDENGRVLKTVSAKTDAATLKVDQDYVPEEGSKQLAGWATTQGSKTADYKNGDSITLTADSTDLYPVCLGGYWLKFDPNIDKLVDPTKANYTAPVFAFEGENPSKPADPVRKGYTFGGWYEDAGLTTAYNFDSPLSADKTVYAKWTPGETTYQVIFWKQKTTDAPNLPNDQKSYDFFEALSVERKATTGATASITDADKGQATSSRHGIVSGTEKWNFFEYNATNSDTDSVVVKGDGSTVLNVYYDRKTITFNFYNSSSYGSKPTSYSGLYGAAFTDWPNPGNGQVWYSGAGSNIRYPMPLRMFDNADYGSASSNQPVTMNFYKTSFYSDATLHYMGQTLQGGNDYSEMFSFKASKNNNWYPTEKIIGFTLKEWRNGTSGSWTPITESGSAYIDSSNAYFRFTRNQHKFVMFSDNAEVKNETLFYEAPLSSYASFVPTNGPEGMFFDGWYADPACTQAFDFNTTMPDNDVKVYAKWTTMRFRVTVDDVTESTATFPAGQVHSFVVDWGEKVGSSAFNAATREGYQLAGWYADAAMTQRFSFDFAAWDQIAVMPYSEDGTPAIKGKVTLYAKWRQRLNGDEAIKVVYDAVDGTINGEKTFTDPLNYADLAQAIAQPAAVPGTVGSQFVYWQVMNADGQPTGVQVKPGDTFDVKLADALTEGKNHTVTLQAVYASDAQLNITWVGNGGAAADSATSIVDSTSPNVLVDVKAADTFTREGYEFLGWARVAEADAKDGESWKQMDLGEDDLWLVWNEEAQEYKLNADKVEFVAAKTTGTPCVLYAVWKQFGNYTYVMDFNAKMTLANEAKAMQDNTSKNGVFSLDSAKSTVSYQFNQVTKDKGILDGAALVFDGVDTALVRGKPVNVDGAKVAWNKLNVIPADNVYFDDDLVEKTVAVGDGSGYNADVQFANAEKMAAGSYTFTFNGTGVDIYCTTNGDTGSIVAKLTDKDGKTTYQGMYNHAETERYNIPTISYRDLAYGTYTVTLTVVNGIEYRFDGVRIYNPTNNGTQFANMRDALLNDGKNTKVVGNVDDKDAQSGVLFVDDRSKMALEQDQIDAQTQKPTGKTIEVYKSDFEAYKANSPKNEIYLGYEGMPQTDGSTVAANQSLTFALTEEARSAGVWIGLSAPDKNGQTGKVTIGGVPVDVTSAVDMYYPITADMIGADGVVTITNTGKAMISVTNLKVTGMESAAGASSLFAPITERIVKIAANNGVDPDQVKDAWNANAWNPKQMLNALFQLLMQSLSGLFNGLGNW